MDLDFFFFDTNGFRYVGENEMHCKNGSDN